MSIQLLRHETLKAIVKSSLIADIWWQLSDYGFYQYHLMTKSATTWLPKIIKIYENCFMLNNLQISLIITNEICKMHFH